MNHHVIHTGTVESLHRDGRPLTPGPSPPEGRGEQCYDLNRDRPSKQPQRTMAE